MLSYIKKIIALDYRSLALLRILVGITLLSDVIQRAHSLTAHYTDKGVLPRAELFRLWNEPVFWSIYNINGTTFFVGLLFFVAGVFSLMMIVGYKTRIATIVSFVLLISLHNRNPMVLQGGDIALRVILFFMMFMPLAKRFSLDGILGNENPPVGKEYTSPIGAIYLIQFLLIWTMSGFFKTGTPWTTSFTAVSMALTLDSFTTSWGNFLKTMPELMRYFTMVTILIERYVFINFLIPIYNGIFRIIGLTLLTLLIIGFNTSFRLVIFGLIMFSISVGLLPALFWDKIVKNIHRVLSNKSYPGIIIFYDGGCGFCSRLSNAISKILFLHPSTVVKPANKDEDASRVMHAAHSWVVRDTSGNTYTGFRAFVALMQSAFLYRIVAPIFLFKPFLYIGEYVYKLISHNRPMKCVVYKDDLSNNISKKYFTNLIYIFVFIIGVFIILWNIKTLPQYSNKFDSKFLRNSLMVFRLDQKWNMFSPYPTLEDGWYVIPGVLRDDSRINVYTGKYYIDYDKPHLASYTYKDQRWQKYMMNLWLQDYSKYRLGYGQYLCRQWNQNNSYEKNLLTFEIVYMLEETDFNTLKESSPKPVVIWEHRCFP